MRLTIENFIGSTLLTLCQGGRPVAAVVISIDELASLCEAKRNSSPWMKNEEIAVIPVKVTRFDYWPQSYNVIIGTEQIFLPTTVWGAALDHAKSRNSEPLSVGGYES